MIDVDNIWDTIIAVLLAIAGGLARLLNRKDRIRMKWSRILSELFISGFCGLMVLMLARAMNISGGWVGVVSGLAGWTGPRVLDVVSNITGKSTVIDLDKKDK